MRSEMSGGGRGGASAAAAAGAPAAAIPASARKVVQSLKEVVTGHGDEEIYAMLKECNMDPNETAQRLMNQDTFHEVKRRRDKKKEATPTNKDAFEGRSRGTGAFRGGRSGGRGGSLPRYVSNDSNGRGKPLPPRENGNHVPSAGSTTEAKSSTQSGNIAGASPGLPNGSIQYPINTPPTQGTWSKLSGHATMADMLKSSNGPPAAVATGASGSAGQQFSSSGMYSSSDPVHHPFSDQRAPGGVNAVKREIGIVGNQRPIGDRTASFSGGSLPQPSSTQDEVQPASPPRPQETSKPQESVPSTGQTSGFRSSAVGNGRPYQQQQQSANVNKTSGLNLEWKPKLVAQDTAAVSGLNAMESVVTEALKSPPASVIAESEVLSVSTKFQNLSTREEQQVIMPNNFQSQGDLGLSFGSFGESFGSSLPSGFSEDGLDISGSSEASAPVKDMLHEQSPSGTDVVTPDESTIHQDDIPVQRDRNDSTSTSIPATYTSQPDITKLRSAQQAQQQYSSYLQAAPTYSSGIGMTPQISGGQHTFDSQESHMQEMPSAATTMKQQQQQQQQQQQHQQNYADSGTSFYFRPGSDGDPRYQYLPANATAKYNNATVVVPGQHLPATHEVTNSTALSSSSAASQTPQTGNTHSMPAPQQPLPVHAYPAQPAGMPVGHFGNVFGYQYPGYTIVPSPYQHSYTTSYPQPPVSSYSPSANYAPGGVAAVKYTLPQYKPGNVTANAPLSAVSGGYGGYGTASSMYAANPTATASNTPGYEDAGAAQYKDSNLYIHGPQGDGARLWQLSSDVAAAQTSSFYALSGQNQHTSYTQPSSHTHPMAGYTSLYHHPSQPGPAGNAHQMIQQPQTLSGAAGSTQVGATTYHQQLQRMQQPSWNAY